MIECPVCSESLKAQKLTCERCHLGYEGDFYMPRLARLTLEQQKFVEMLVLSGGNLKELAGTMDVSYPTLRKRLDVLIKEVKALRHSDEQKIASILKHIEKGNIPAEKGLRQIKEMNGEL